MILIKLILYVCVALVAIVDVVLLIKLIEFMTCVVVMRQVPFVPSAVALRRAVVDEIRTHYPDARRVCEIGAGYGGLVRTIARATDADVVGIENMPLSAMVGRIMNASCARAHIVWADAFQYLKSGEKFDVAVVYLGPEFVTRLMDYRGRFGTLISLDFAAANIPPTRVVDVGRGYTRYLGRRYPHRLYIYEF